MWSPSELELINSVASVAVGVSVLSGLNPHFLPGGLNASKLLEGHCSIPGSHGLSLSPLSCVLPPQVCLYTRFKAPRKILDGNMNSSGVPKDWGSLGWSGRLCQQRGSSIAGVP